MTTDIWQKPVQYEQDGDILFGVDPTPAKKPAPPPIVKKTPPPVVIAVYVYLNGQPPKVLTNDEWLARRATALVARTNEVHQFAAMHDELAAMDADLAAFRAQTVSPLVTCQTLEEMHPLREDEVGE